ncbi:hypothetical protein [Trueperella pyogenes]|uniref:DUF3168 domain-containing protein n=1 Tax=Trueperella pyogenes TaxID=1661 RepID=A0ABV3NE13_9ACTO
MSAPLSQPLLEVVTGVCEALAIPVRVSLFTPTPLPDTFAVTTPLGDDLGLWADGAPGVEIEQARLSLYTTGNYLPLRDQVTAAFLAAGVTITGRTYVGFEDETGYHHYAIDLAAHHTY